MDPLIRTKNHVCLQQGIHPSPCKLGYLAFCLQHLLNNTSTPNAKLFQPRISNIWNGKIRKLNSRHPDANTRCKSSTSRNTIPNIIGDTFNTLGKTGLIGEFSKIPSKFISARKSVQHPDSKTRCKGSTSPNNTSRIIVDKSNPLEKNGSIAEFNNIPSEFISTYKSKHIFLNGKI